MGDESWLYIYCGSGLHGTGYTDVVPGVPRNSIGRAVWRRWGFVSLETASSGLVRTRPLRLASGNMTVNFKRLRNDGRVKVAAFASGGRSLANAVAYGDGTRQRLNWNRPLPTNEPIELQFEIQRGALYSVEVE